MKKEETAEEFVRRMLTGLTAKTLPDYPNSVFYVNDKDELIVEIEKNDAWCRWTGFLNVLKNEYKLKYSESKELIKPIVEKILNIDGITPKTSLSSYTKIVESELINDYRNIEKTVLKEYQNGNIVVFSTEGLMTCRIDEFIKQSADGILYDLNRDEAVILTFINDPKWINDYAVAKVIRALKEKIDKLEAELKTK